MYIIKTFVGASIEKLCEAVFEDSINDRASVIRAARCLLSSVTRVLLLADVVVVKQLISVKDKVRIFKYVLTMIFERTPSRLVVVF